MVAGLRTALVEPLATYVAQVPGTYKAGPVANAGYAQWVMLYVHVTAVSGSATVTAALESSPDGTTWTLIPGSAITALTAAGNAIATAAVNNEYVRVTSTEAGAATTATYSVAVMVIPA